MASVNGGAITKTKNQRTIKDLVKSMGGEIQKALPSVITPERFSRMVLTAISKNPRLGECTPGSFLGAMMQAAQLGVEPNTPIGQAYLVPYKNHGVLECQFQIGYKGLIDLAYRSGDVKDISAHEVRENDVFEYELGMEPKLKHIPALNDRGEVILYYAVFHTKGGGYGFEVMSREDVQKYMQQYSRAAEKGSSPWSTNFDEMAKKTVIKRLLKYAPIRAEFVRAVAADGTIKTEISSEMVDLPDETIIEAEAVEEEEKEKKE